MAHPAAHPDHQLTNHRQSDALPAFAGAEERQKDLPLQSDRHARTVVANADLQATAATLPGLHPQLRLALLAGRLLRIVDEGEQHLLELTFVGHEPQPWRAHFE